MVLTRCEGGPSTSTQKILSAIETIRQQTMEKNPPIIEELHEVNVNQIVNANMEALQAIRDGQQMMQQG